MLVAKSNDEHLNETNERARKTGPERIRLQVLGPTALFS